MMMDDFSKIIISIKCEICQFPVVFVNDISLTRKAEVTLMQPEPFIEPSCSRTP